MSQNPIQDALRALPQFPHIRRDDAARWLEAMTRRDPKRLMWHLERLRAGFGGSEIGTLILDALGRSGPFTSARELVNEKLMRILPQSTTHQMRKGIWLEEAATQAVLMLHGGECDENTLAAFRQRCDRDPFGIGGNPDFPWRREGAYYLADIKLPGSGEETLTSADKQLLYLVQLNVYNMLNEARELEPFEKLINIHIELPPTVTDAMMMRLDAGGEAEVAGIARDMAALLRYDQPGMRLNIVEQPINPSIDFHGNRPLVEVIQEVAAINYEAVLAGKVPAPAALGPLTLPDDDQAALEAHQARLLTLHALEDLTKQEIEATQADISALCRPIQQAGDLSPSPHLLIKQEPTLNADACLTLCQRYGIDTESLRSDRDEKKALLVRDYDTLAMADALRERGVDMTPFVRPTPMDPQKVIKALSDIGEHPARAIRYQTRIAKSQKAITKTLMREKREQLAASLATLTAPVQAPAAPDPDLEAFAEVSLSPESTQELSHSR